MAEESKEMAELVTSTNDETKKMKKKKKGMMSKLWNTLFRSRGDDFEKRLQDISKEEASVLSRIGKRTHSVRRLTRRLIFFFLFCEIIAVCYAIMTTRSARFNWQTRALHVLPMFLLPAISLITYSIINRFCKMRDEKDHKTLEKLRAERQAKIDELKEKTNYYMTQQLIQRYDPDPAAKAAAATVLASKLGAESGLKVHLGDIIDPNAPSGKSNDVEVSKKSGLRQRKQPLSRSASLDSGSSTAAANLGDNTYDSAEPADQNPLVVEHHPQSGPSSNDGGWIARLAALLVGEDPTQSYALICGNCHMHNGLARKEDFPYITYYCPHCHALNRPTHAEEAHVPSTPDSSALTASLPTVDDTEETEETTSSTTSALAPPRTTPAEEIPGS